MIATLMPKEARISPTGTVLERLPHGVKLPFGLQDQLEEGGDRDVEREVERVVDVVRDAKGAGSTAAAMASTGSGAAAAAGIHNVTAVGGGAHFTATATAAFPSSSPATPATAAVGAVSVRSAAPIRHKHAAVKPISYFLAPPLSSAATATVTADPTTTSGTISTAVSASMAALMIPEKTVCRFFRIFDVVTLASARSMCFTKGYGAYEYTA